MSVIIGEGRGASVRPQKFLLNEEFMATACAKLKDLVVLNGASVSNIWLAREVYEDAVRVLMTCESADVATFTLEVTDDAEPSAAGSWKTYQELNGAVLADFVIPNVATKAWALPQGALASTGIRLKASGNVTADRTYGASKQYNIAI